MSERHRPFLDEDATPREGHGAADKVRGGEDDAEPVYAEGARTLAVDYDESQHRYKEWHKAVFGVVKSL